jgi:hypothetical protein
VEEAVRGPTVSDLRSSVRSRGEEKIKRKRETFFPRNEGSEERWQTEEEKKQKQNKFRLNDNKAGEALGDQMSLGKNRPNCSPTHFFVKISAQVSPWKKVAHKFWLLL